MNKLVIYISIVVVAIILLTLRFACGIGPPPPPLMHNNNDPLKIKTDVLKDEPTEKRNDTVSPYLVVKPEDENDGKYNEDYDSYINNVLDRETPIKKEYVPHGISIHDHILYEGWIIRYDPFQLEIRYYYYIPYQQKEDGWQYFLTKKDATDLNIMPYDVNDSRHRLRQSTYKKMIALCNFKK